MNSWIIPCNPKNYDVIRAFQNLKEIDWKQSIKNIDAGDKVYIYVSSPYKQILYQCVVVRTNLPSQEIDDMAFVKDGTPFLNYGPHMRLQMIRKLNGLELNLSDLKKRGLRGNIQGPRTVSGELLDYIESVIDRSSV